MKLSKGLLFVVSVLASGCDYIGIPDFSPRPPAIPEETIHFENWKTENGYEIPELEEILKLTELPPLEDTVDKEEVVILEEEPSERILPFSSAELPKELPLPDTFEAQNRLSDSTDTQDEKNQRADVLDKILEDGRLPQCVEDFAEWFYRHNGMPMDLTYLKLRNQKMDFAEAHTPNPYLILFNDIIHNIQDQWYIEILMHELVHIYQHQNVPGFAINYVLELLSQENWQEPTSTQVSFELEAHDIDKKATSYFFFFDPCEISFVANSYFKLTGERWHKELSYPEDLGEWIDSQTPLKLMHPAVLSTVDEALNPKPKTLIPEPEVAPSLVLRRLKALENKRHTELSTP